jgi:hypothetical protein
VSSVLLPCGIAVLLVLFWVELPMLDRCLGGRVSRGRLRRALRRPRYPLRGNRARSPAAPTARPIQEIAADLRRLSRQLALVPAGAPLVRWRALWAAYDSVLMEAAAQLEVTHTLPGTPVGMARDIERLRMVAALEGAGLVVRG